MQSRRAKGMEMKTSAMAFWCIESTARVTTVDGAWSWSRRTRSPPTFLVSPCGPRGVLNPHSRVVAGLSIGGGAPPRPPHCPIRRHVRGSPSWARTRRSAGGPQRIPGATLCF